MIIVDIDNCISDDLWRCRYILKNENIPFKKFHKYHSLSAFDKSFPFAQYCEHIENGEKIAFITGRPELYRHTTEHWLDINGYEYDYLIMRQNDDNFSSPQFKSKAVLNLMAVDREDITMCYDDREDVLNVFQRLNLATTRISINEHLCFGYQP